MTELEVISSSETFLETTLSFLKEFADRKSYSDIRDDYQELVMLNMVNLPSQSSIIPWVISLCTLDSQITVCYRSTFFCNQCDQEGFRKPIVVFSILQGKKKLRSIDFAPFGVLYTIECS